MQHFKFYIGLLIVLVIGVFLTGCGAADVNQPSPNSGELPTDGELPDVEMPEGPIVNLPGEVPYQDQEREPGQADMVAGNAFVNSADLVIMESYPVQVSLALSGELPTPCNKLTVDISEPNADNQIHIEVYSLVDPAMTCIAMIEPFDEQISLPVENLADGTYEVWVNGTLVGEFNYPG